MIGPVPVVWCVLAAATTAVATITQGTHIAIAPEDTKIGECIESCSRLCLDFHTCTLFVSSDTPTPWRVVATMPSNGMFCMFALC